MSSSVSGKTPKQTDGGENSVESLKAMETFADVSFVV